MFKSIRKSIGLSSLKRKLKRVERQRNMPNWNQIKSIGLVTSVEYEQYHKIVNDFASNNKQLKVTVVRAQSGEQLSSNLIDYKEYSEKDLNWFLKPSNADLEQFVNTGFDVLFFCNPNQDDSILWIYELSKAKLKVGYDQDHYLTQPDFMFTAKDDANHIKNILKETEFYLKQINR